METINLGILTISSFLSGIPVDSHTHNNMSKHILPAIAGQWEIELDLVDNQSTFINNNSVIQSLYDPSKDLNDTTLHVSSNYNTYSKKCHEIYNFDEDYKFRVVSNQEWTWGHYLVTYPDEGLPIIGIKTLYDNNKIDCSGNQIDQSGESTIAYLDYQGSTMRWCSDPEGKECSVTFHRIFP